MIQRTMLLSFIAATILSLGACSSGKRGGRSSDAISADVPSGSDDTGPVDSDAQATDMTDAADQSDAADTADATDSADGNDGSDGTDELDAVDATDGVDVADGADGVDSDVSTDGVDGSTGVDADGGDTIFGVLEIEDDPNNATLNPCDSGTLKSPGSDIDSAELNAGSYLSDCELYETSACESTASEPQNAEGSPDATGSEETGTYVSLNGGLLRCRWDGGAAVTPSDTITVIEISGTSGTNVEQYRIRICDRLTGGCKKNSPYASGGASFSGSDLF